MISFELLTSFACAARHRSFARAARELGTSPSAVAKNVARLESQLKLRLFHRTTRRVALTPDGELLQERCRRVLHEVAELEGAVAGKLAGPSGTLKLDVPIVYGRRVVLPVLAKLRHRYPDLAFDVRFSDRIADVVGEGLDAVIRVGTLDDSSLVARRVGWQRMWTGVSCSAFPPAARSGRGVSASARVRSWCVPRLRSGSTTARRWLRQRLLAWVSCTYPATWRSKRLRAAGSRRYSAACDRL